MNKNLIFGAKDAAKIIGISYRTICRYMNKEDFPKPIMEQDRAEGGKLRWWEKEDLLKFKEIMLKNKEKQKKGRPLKILKDKDIDKKAE